MRAQNRQAVESPQVVDVLKRDVLGRVERVRVAGGASEELVRRVASGSRVPGSALVGRLLLAREAAALERLGGLPGVPRLAQRAPAGDVLLRGWIEGDGLHRAEDLPRDFFERLEELVRSVHARGVCHNDLHKEQNVLVDRAGYPALVDFQLASVHARRGALYRSRCRDDLRHVEKHRRRYLAGAGRGGELDRTHRLRRSWVALAWRRLGKPAYNFATRVVLRTRDGEPRRPSTGPWPRWTEPVGPREGGNGAGGLRARPGASGGV